MKTIQEKVAVYYEEKLSQFGNTPRGVDWNGEQSQLVRFNELCKIIDRPDFSILDYGCGYGAFYNYLKTFQKNFTYTGFDISIKMIEAAGSNTKCSTDVFFTNEEKFLKPCDYVIASGIFNVRLDVTDKNWENYIADTLLKMEKLSKKGLAFNILSAECDTEYKKDYLYYVDPSRLLDSCKIFSNNMKILKDYSLYEFTVLIIK